MSGRASLQGFAIQTLSIILDSLKEGDDWTSVQLEPIVPKTNAKKPGEVSEKADVIWNYVGYRKATQIKHSVDAIGKPDLEDWAEAMEKEVRADEYELIPFGVFSGPAADLAGAKHGKVQIRAPQPLAFDTLTEQAAHRLAAYLERRGMRILTPTKTKILVGQLRAKIEDLATKGTTVTREQLDFMLRGWILDIEPEVATREINDFAAGARERAEGLRVLEDARDGRPKVDNQVRVAVAPVLLRPLPLHRSAENEVRRLIAETYCLSPIEVATIASPAEFTDFASQEEPVFLRRWRVTTDGAVAAATPAHAPGGPVSLLRLVQETLNGLFLADQLLSSQGRTGPVLIGFTLRLEPDAIGGRLLLGNREKELIGLPKTGVPTPMGPLERRCGGRLTSDELRTPAGKVAEWFNDVFRAMFSASVDLDGLRAYVTEQATELSRNRARHW